MSNEVFWAGDDAKKEGKQRDRKKRGSKGSRGENDASDHQMNGDDRWTTTKKKKKTVSSDHLDVA